MESHKACAIYTHTIKLETDSREELGRGSYCMECSVLWIGSQVWDSHMMTCKLQHALQYSYWPELFPCSVSDQVPSPTVGYLMCYHLQQNDWHTPIVLCCTSKLFVPVKQSTMHADTRVGTWTSSMHQITGTIDHVCSMLYLRHWSRAYVLLVQCPVSILATTITQMCNSVTWVIVDIRVMRDIQTAGLVLVLTAVPVCWWHYSLTIVSENMSAG